MRRILAIATLVLMISGTVATSVQAAMDVIGANVVAPSTQLHWPPITDKECLAPPPPPPPNGPKPPPVTIAVQGIEGADVSEYEGQIDWAKLGAQKKFVIMRFSHGAHIDAQFASFWRSARRVGVIRGAYVYLDPLDPHPFADQLRSFVNGVKLKNGDLAPILDLENPCLYLHMSVPERIAYVLNWANALQKAYGVKPIIYMSPSFVDRALGGASNAAVLKKYPLWIAHYHDALPIVPLPWTTYIIWQYADDAPLSGVSIPADADVAPLTLADLKKYTVHRRHRR